MPVQKTYRVLPCNSKIIFTILLSGFILLSRCDKKENLEYTFNLPLQTPVLQISYAGKYLFSEETRPFVSSASSQIEKIPEYSWPEARTVNGTPCIVSMQNPYFDLESGLRFKYCDPGINQSEVQNIFSEALKDQTSYPEFADKNLEIKILTASGIRNAYRKIFHSFDGSLNASLIKNGLEGMSENFSYSQNPGPNSLFRKFPLLYFHMMISENHLLFVYEIPDKLNRFLVIAVRSPGKMNFEKRSILNMKKINSEILLQAQEASGTDNVFFVSEIYFGKQGGAGSEFIEIANPNPSPSLQTVTLSLDGNIFKKTILLLPESVSLFSRSFDDTIRFQNTASFNSKNSGETYTYETFLKDGLSPERTACRESAVFLKTEGLRPSMSCASQKNPCGSEGIHPVFFQNPFGSDDGGEPICSIDDFSLSEINPFGVYFPEDSAGINPSGKFAEFKLKKSCFNRSIVFIIPPAVLDTGNASLNEGEVLLFSADSSFFTESSRENSYLRSITPGGRVEALDLRSGIQKTLKGEDSDGRIYIYGFNGSSLMSRVYSLAFHSGYADFHGKTASGLRPDLLSRHSMSPGYENPSLASPSYGINEIYPMGSIRPDGSSAPDDEFIEFIKKSESSSSSASSSSLLLKIVHSETAKIKIYQFPKPEGQTAALMKNIPVCFTPSDSIMTAGLFSLWNAPSSYSLHEADGSLLDEAEISDVLYEKMDSSSRTSYVKIFPENIGTLSSRPSSGCPYTSFASPGENNSFSPFLHRMFSGNDSAEYILFSENPSEKITISSGKSLISPDFVSTREVLNREKITVVPQNPAGKNRILVSLIPEGSGSGITEEFFIPAPLLVFQTVFPVPPSGESEWVRICSPAGFQSQDLASGLFIKDSSNTDRIVPYLSRFPSATMPGMDGTSMDLPAGSCAILVDPDFNPQNQNLPLRAGDTALWTIETTAAIGNDISSGEGLMLYRMEADTSVSPLSTFGLPDTDSPFSLYAGGGRTVERVSGTYKDLRENYRILP